MSGLWDRIRSPFTKTQAQQDAEAGYGQQLLSQLEEATTLNRTQRWVGFSISFGLGLLCSWMAMFFLLSPTRFAVLYTFGALLSMTSFMFLIGPLKQVKSMFSKGRWIATTAYVGTLILTLVVAYRVENSGARLLLILMCLAAQFTALVWYIFSWFPGGQAFFLRMFGIQVNEGI